MGDGSCRKKKKKTHTHTHTHRGSSPTRAHTHAPVSRMVSPSYDTTATRLAFRGHVFAKAGHSQVEVALVDYPAEHRDEGLFAARALFLLFGGDGFLGRGGRLPWFTCRRSFSLAVFPWKDSQQVDHLHTRKRTARNPQLGALSLDCLSCGSLSSPGLGVIQLRGDRSCQRDGGACS